MSADRRLQLVIWVVVVLAAAAAGSAAVAEQLSPTLAVVIPALAAGIGVLGPVVADQVHKRRQAVRDGRAEMLKAEAQREEDARRRKQRIDALLLEWPLRIADAAPADLGVTPSAKADSYAPEDGSAPYVERDVDDRLRSALESRRFVLIHGASKAGKSRTAYEALQALFPDDLVLVPVRPDVEKGVLRRLFVELDVLEDAGDCRVVLWLDDVAHFVRNGALDPPLVRRLGRRPSVVIVATIRDSELGKLSEDERVVLAGAKRVRLESQLSDDEWARAEDAYSGEDFSAGLGVQLVDAPLLVERFEAGRSACPQGHAIVAAAVDWERVTLRELIARQDLWELARLPEYRAAIARGISFGDDELEHGLRWSLERLPSDTALLYAVDDQGESFEAFDYVVDYFEGAVHEADSERAIPPSVWERALAQLSPADVVHVGLSAQFRQNWDVARRAYTKAREDAEHGMRATVNLAVMEVETGHVERGRAALLDVLDAPPDDLPVELRAVALAKAAIATSLLGDDRELAWRLSEDAIKVAEKAPADSGVVLTSLHARGTVALYWGSPEMVDAADRAAQAAEDADPYDAEALEALLLLARALVQPGPNRDVDRAREVADRALEWALEYFGDRHTITGSAFSVRGEILMLAGDAGAAEDDFRRAQEIFETSLGPESLVASESLVRLAVVERNAGDLEQSRRDLERAVSMKQAIMRDDRAMIAALVQLGLARRMVGELEGARTVLERAARAAEAAEHSQAQAQALYELGVVKRMVGDLEGARTVLERAARAAEAAEHSQAQAQALHELGVVKRMAGDVIGARETLEHAAAAKLALVGERDLSYAHTLYELGLVSRLAGELDDANAHLEHAAEIEEASGAETSLAHTLRELGVTKRLAGDTVGARRDLEASAGLLRATPVRDEWILGSTLHELAIVDRSERNLHEAARGFERVLAIADGGPTPDVGRIAVAAYELGVTLRMLQDLDGALGAHARAIAGYEQLGEPAHAAHSRHEVGLIALDRGDYDAAERHLAESLSALSAAHGEDSPHVADVMLDLGRVSAAADRPDAAKTWLEWGLAAARATHRDEPPARDALALLRRVVGGLKRGGAPDERISVGALGSVSVQRRRVFELRRRALDGEDVRAALEPCLPRIAAGIVAPFLEGRAPEAWDCDGLEARVSNIAGEPLALDDCERRADSERELAAAVADMLRRRWETRERALEPELTRALERYLLLNVIDSWWPDQRDELYRRIEANGDDASAPGEPRLYDTLWPAFLEMLFNVTVKVEGGADAAQPPRTTRARDAEG